MSSRKPLQSFIREDLFLSFPWEAQSLVLLCKWRSRIVPALIVWIDVFLRHRIRKLFVHPIFVKSLLLVKASKLCLLGRSVPILVMRDPIIMEWMTTRVILRIASVFTMLLHVSCQCCRPQEFLIAVTAYVRSLRLMLLFVVL